MLERLFPQQADDRLVVEDVFSTWLYTGNGSTQTITNGIDLAGKGGLVWVKKRIAAASHGLYDTIRGANKLLISEKTDAEATYSGVSGFLANGFSLGSGNEFNQSTQTFASWTFRKAPKFFDVVTWTGTGVVRDIPHSLGVSPGMIIIKITSGAGNWTVYHRSIGSNYNLVLNTFSAQAFNSGIFPRVTSTSFGIDYVNDYNASGQTYVAYLFAHDPSADGIIQCGTYQGSSSSPIVVNLGWEPQWLMVKNVTSLGGWVMGDIMRGFTTTTDGALRANGSDAEVQTDWGCPTATGFELTGSGIWTSGEINSGSSLTQYIYIAIRRGPMRTPTLGTSVFSPTLTTAYGPNNLITTGFPVDLCLGRVRANGYSTDAFDRLRGTGVSSGRYLRTNNTDAEAANASYGVGLTSNTGFFSNWWTQDIGVQWNFRRAPGFFDEVCYTGTGVARTVAHNLAAVPELMIVKMRSGVSYWLVYSQTLGVNSELALQLNSAADTGGGLSYWNSTAPTSSVISLGTSPSTNSSGSTYVAYLFASVPGVSKVGSYTGNGSSQTINCAFTTGARFVLIKRTNAAGDWWVWDTARGIVSANDPALRLNSTAAETTGNDSVDPDSTGFVVNQDSTTNINVNAATYIFLAIA
jgi:hypothetical protein